MRITIDTDASPAQATQPAAGGAGSTVAASGSRGQHAKSGHSLFDVRSDYKSALHRSAERWPSSFVG